MLALAEVGYAAAAHCVASILTDVCRAGETLTERRLITTNL